MTAIPTHEQFRAVGFTGAAADHPRDEMAIAMFAAFNGVTVEQLPEPFKYFPNVATEKAWKRVADAARAHLTAPKAEDSCPECSRPKAKNSKDAAAGLCPKWWAIRDADAERDCLRIVEQTNDQL